MEQEKLKINFEYCYGIKEFSKEIDFSRSHSITIYAPNGIMKTSFAKTFQDLSFDIKSEDRVFKNRETKRNITDGNNTEIPRENIFVIEPYNTVYRSSKISTLLVNQELKNQYEALHEEINNKKDVLVKELQKISGLKNNLEETLSEAITHDKKNFFNALIRLRTEVNEQKSTFLAETKYQEIFNDKVITLLEDKDFLNKLSEYINIYDNLISSSTFFKKGIFNHNNAFDITKNLTDNGFFNAGHGVYINTNTGKKEMYTKEELENHIQQEKNNIINNPELIKSFDAIDTKIKKNKELKEFREYLENNKFILPELENLEKLKQNLWIAYLSKILIPYNELIDVYELNKTKIKEVIEQAKKEQTKWLEVIHIFNKRFSVPFFVSMGNQEDVILKSDTPNIKFNFKNNEDSAVIPIDEDRLKDVLSNGEKRALYLLNIIFEVEARKSVKQETIFIIDDIADSFDYKNKYAIVEYLKDISDEPYFYQIILSHNFDFYRTISSRLSLPRQNRFYALKSQTNINIIEEIYQKNPFDHWKDNFNNTQMLIAAIPFIRNLAEYCGFNSEFLKLTSLLHQKNDTDSIKVEDLQNIIRNILKDNNNLILLDGDKLVKNLIYENADSICLETDEIVNLEKKIVLSIAIRLKAEIFMINRINNLVFLNGITSNQTIKLIEEYKKSFSTEIENIKLMEQVNLMTPENIHLNSFMYEPILDMDKVHLKDLYLKISTLN